MFRASNIAFAEKADVGATQKHWDQKQLLAHFGFVALTCNLLVLSPNLLFNLGFVALTQNFLGHLGLNLQLEITPKLFAFHSWIECNINKVIQSGLMNYNSSPRMVTVRLKVRGWHLAMLNHLPAPTFEFCNC